MQAAVLAVAQGRGSAGADAPPAAPYLDPRPLALLRFALQAGPDGIPELGKQLLHHQVAQDLQGQEAVGTLLIPHPCLGAMGGARDLTWVSLPHSMSHVPYCSFDWRYMRTASVKAGASTLESSEMPGNEG